jgi:hypothetical protein
MTVVGVGFESRGRELATESARLSPYDRIPVRSFHSRVKIVSGEQLTHAARAGHRRTDRREWKRGPQQVQRRAPQQTVDEPALVSVIRHRPHMFQQCGVRRGLGGGA